MFLCNCKEQLDPVVPLMKYVLFKPKFSSKSHLVFYWHAPYELALSDYVLPENMFGIVKFDYV